MKKIILTLLVAVMAMPMAMFADTYTSLWKQYENAKRKDLPQTGINVLAKIINKSTTERAYGHLLKAQLLTIEAQATVAPDSLLPAINRLEAIASAAESKDAVLAAVYHSVLGSAYQDNPSLAEDYKERSKSHFVKSMANPDALAKSVATGYEPFVVDGIDSRIFGDDMLHIIGFAADDLRALHDYYEKAGNRSATCMVALKMLQQSKNGTVTEMRKSKYMQSVDSLLNEYKDLAVAGELAIERYSVMSEAEDAVPEDLMNYINYALTQWGAWPRMNILRNAQARLTLPSFHVSLGEGISLPNTPRKVILMRVCNIGELTMTVRRLNVSGDTELNPSVDSDYAKLKAKLNNEEPFTQTRRYIGLPNYKVTRDTMEIKGLPVGVYLVEFTTNNTSLKAERALLRVSDLYVVHEALPGKRIRFAVLNATSGQPVAGATLRLTSYNGGWNEDNKVQNTLVCDAKGETIYTYKNLPASFYASTEADKAFPEVNYSGSFTYYNYKVDYDNLNLFTDRKIYRPGQTVNVSAVLYHQTGDDARSLGNQDVTLKLQDANHKEVASHSVVTDKYGVVSTSFVLPTGGLTGNFSIVGSTKGSSNTSGTVWIKVEEYKRPTYEMMFDKLDAKYQAGDTVVVTGKAKSYSGIAVQGAKVSYRVVRRPSLWWYRTTRYSEQQIFADSTITDGSGCFKARVPMIMPEEENTREKIARYFAFDVIAKITDAAGESHEATISVPLGDKPTAFSCDLPDKIERDSLKSILFSYTNAGGENIDGDVVYYVDDMRFTAKANLHSAISLANISSASHLLTAYCGTDTIKQEFVVFTMADKKAATQTHDWFYTTGGEFHADGSPVYVQVGSSDSIQHIVYTMIAGDQLLESGTIELQGELNTRAFTYKPEYGDALVLTYAWVKEGKAYRHSATIYRPQKDTHLKTHWTTFRDRLTPGQKEEWTLHVASPDGTAAKAQVMATMYDKSLDQIAKHSWSLSLDNLRSCPRTAWIGSTSFVGSLYGEQPYRPLNERGLDFSHFYDTYFGFGNRSMFFYETCEDSAPLLTSNAVLAKQSSSALGSADSKMLKSRSAATKVEAAKAMDAAVIGYGMAATGANEEESAATLAAPSVRENLSETAFFYPNVETDANGDVKLKFTLPESVTTWRLLGIAHDQQMNTDVFDAEAVAQKTVMAQPNMPRFVRANDKGNIAVRLSNTSDKKLSGTVKMELLNPELQKAVKTTTAKFSIDKDTTIVVYMPFDMSKTANDGLLICRISASGHGFSDGEQNYLPVLAAFEQVVNSVPFTQLKPGIKTIDLTKLFAANAKNGRLTVEYTNNPSWLMVKTLPNIIDVCDKDAISLATAYYANTLGLKLMNLSPGIRQTVELWSKDANNSLTSNLQTNEDLKQLLLQETPWVADAERETESMRRLASFYDSSSMNYRCTSYLAKLKQLQNFDGSFGWWPGMKGSGYVSLSVAQTLARLSVMADGGDEYEPMLKSAVDYLGSIVAKECNEMRKAEKKGEKNVRPSEFAVGYLYICSLIDYKKSMNLSRQTDYNYLITRLARQNTAFTIYGKAVASVVLNASGHKSEAATLLKSIREYTVAKEDMGRYFDTPKASYSWRDYRIPSQVAAIEALTRIEPADSSIVNEMKLWLLQSKRTQGWDNPINTVDAVYAFLGCGGERTLTVSAADAAVLKIDGEKITADKHTAGLGYVKATKNGSNMRTFTADKKTAGTSWGAVYAQYVQPIEDVASASAGMSIERAFYKDGKRLSATSGLKVGDRITVRITVKADRDYDFVQLTDKRAACLEPVSQTSGYRGGYYIAPKDNATYYYFDTLSKGSHIIETSYYIDRDGDYRSGICTAQCAYSPEFSARDASVEMQVSR